jgi:hypothetical protein
LTKGLIRVAKVSKRNQEGQDEKPFWDYQLLTKVIPVTEATQIRVSYVEKKGDKEEGDIKGIDIRTYVKRKGETDYTPRTKGIVIRLNQLSEVLEGIQQVMEDKPWEEDEEIPEPPKTKKGTSKRK